MTPFLALCAEGVSDDEGFECMGTRPEIERPSVDTPDGDTESGGSTEEMKAPQADDTGCASRGTLPPLRNHSPLICVLVALMLFSKALLKRYSHSKVDGIQSEGS